MDVEYPENYMCPITLDLMLEPVKASDNKVYDKAAIIDWFKTNKVSPMTREELSPEFVKQNDLQNEINEFIKKNNITVCPYSPKNNKKTLTSESSSYSDSEESEEDETSDLLTFNCTVCNDQLLFSTEIGRTVCSTCNESYKVNLCQNCDSGYIIRSNSSGNFRCRECFAINIVSSRRRRNECTIM